MKAGPVGEGEAMRWRWCFYAVAAIIVTPLLVRAAVGYVVRRALRGA